MYYCHSRYYVPEWCRWLNADSPNFLQPESLNGMNLFSYCGNDPVNNFDPSGHIPQWLMWTIGGIILASSIALTIITAGAAAGTVAASIHAIATGAMVSGITSATIGTLAGGLTYENGNAEWDWLGAAEGFMWGSVTGTISGATGTALSGVGGGLSSFGKIGKLCYAGIQGLINSGISGGLTAIQGLATESLSWDSVGLSLAFGFTGGIVGPTKWGEGLRSILVGIGLGLCEGSSGEIIEWYKSTQQAIMTYLKSAY